MSRGDKAEKLDRPAVRVIESVSRDRHKTDKKNPQCVCCCTPLDSLLLFKENNVTQSYLAQWQRRIVTRNVIEINHLVLRQTGVYSWMEEKKRRK